MLFDLLSAIKALARASTNAQQWNACGEIFTEANTKINDTYPEAFYASYVYTCLSSVPFYVAPALRFLEYFNTTLQFQSTLAFLKNPPTGYQQSPVDVEQILQRIIINVKSGIYQNQYDFEADVQRLVFAMHDGHVDLRSGIMAAFSFGTNAEIVSVSENTTGPPQIYLTGDILYAQSQGNDLSKLSPITKINDEDVISYLTRFASSNSLGRLEAHAEWNDLMSHPTLDIMSRRSIWSGDATFYPGDKLKFHFEDGTVYQTSWWSFYNYGDDTGPIANGGDVYNFFVLGLHPPNNQTDSASRAPDSTVAKRQFVPTMGDRKDRRTKRDLIYDEGNGFGAYPPKPEIYLPPMDINLPDPHNDSLVKGYFLRDISTGVLNLPTFNLFGKELRDFGQTVQNFIDSATVNDINHIVIDLQHNSDGKLSPAFDTFSRFFPGKTPFAGSRRRSHDMSRILGNATTTWWSTLDPHSDDNETRRDWWKGLVDEWVITPRVDVETGKHFHDWNEYAGPKEHLGDAFTLLEEYYLSNASFNYQALEVSPYGYGDKPINTTQAWDPENIVLITDGLCSSACAMFVEFMTRMGVRTVVMGGRPVTGPMQATGTRGALVYTASSLDNDLAWAGLVDKTANQTFPNIPINNQYRNSGIWTPHSGLNLRDQIREDEVARDDAVPLQFKYEAADCRLHYTLFNIYNMTRQWRDVAAAIWDDPSMCVEGSMGFSTTGQNTPKNKPQETSPGPIDDGILGSDYKLPAGYENMSSLEFDSGPFSDKPGSDIKLYTCQLSDEGHHCLLTTKICAPVTVVCENPPWEKPRGTRYQDLHLCLPSCSDDQDCSGYISEAGTLYCARYVPQEEKLRAIHMRPSAEDQTLEPYSNTHKVCMPWQGTPEWCESRD
ncbi:hypothetical protein E8E14_002580 [Neopestalotiopsis sp. 37M]|nr:hypothetical protein E8E14_002580 [Neopestalotiopsis sp. 37M]